MSDNYSRIPDAVRALLRHRWRLPDGTSSFENEYAQRRFEDPSYYIARKGEDPSNSLDYDDMKSLHEDGLFEGLTKMGDVSASINEHAEHALSDFCSEVYEAWAKCEKRLYSVPRSKTRGD